MYFYAERIRAVKLYIKLGKRTGAAIRQLLQSLTRATYLQIYFSFLHGLICNYHAGAGMVIEPFASNEIEEMVCPP